MSAQSIKVIKVQAGQTIADIAIQEYGTAEGMILVLQANPGLGVTSALVAGQELIIFADITIEVVRELVKVEPYASQLQNLLMQWATLINQYIIIAGSHSRQHSVISAADHSAAAEADRNKLVATNPLTGAIEFIEKPSSTPANSGEFKGTCNVLTDPGTPAADEWWSATEVGVYTYFGGVEVSTIEGFYNWLKYDYETTTWSIETVPIKWGGYVPYTMNDILEGYIGESGAIGFKPYGAKKPTDPGFAYIYNSASQPSFTNISKLDGAWHVTILHTGGSTTSFVDIMNGIIKTVGANSLFYSEVKGEMISNQTGSNKLILTGGDTIYVAFSSTGQGNRTLYLGNPSTSGGSNGRHLVVEGGNDRFDIKMSKIKFSYGTANKILSTDANKEITYLDPVTYSFTAADVTCSSNTGDLITGLEQSLKGGAVYEFEVLLLVTSGTDTDGAKYAMVMSGAGSLVGSIEGSMTQTTVQTTSRTRALAPGAYIGPFITGASITGSVIMKGIIRPTGDQTLGIYQQKEATGTVTVAFDSFMKITRIS